MDSRSVDRDASDSPKYHAWKYCITGNKSRTQCSFCGLVMESGGITHFKFHLSHTDLGKNSKKCPNVPPKVKVEILEWI